MPEGKGADGKVKLGHGGLSARCEGIGGEGGQGRGRELCQQDWLLARCEGGGGGECVLEEVCLHNCHSTAIGAVTRPI